VVPDILSTSFLLLIYFLIVIVGGGVQLDPLDTVATNRPIVPNPRLIMLMEKLVEWLLAGEIEVLEENVPQYYFVHHKSSTCFPDANTDCRVGKPATNSLSTAYLSV
jgi:hypothetical protein